MISKYSWHIILAVLATLGNFLGAEQVNSSHTLPEDEYLPIRNRKMGVLFLFLQKNRPVRWRAYWMHRVAQISAAIYFIVLCIGRAITQDFSFLHETGFLYYPVFMACSRAIWEIGIFAYVKIKSTNNG